MSGDLHTHTYCSDGFCPAERNFQLARQTGLDYLAITDHDHLEDFSVFQELGMRYGVSPIYGVEVSTHDYQRGRKVHILCYFPKDPDAVRALCRQTVLNRREAGEEMARLVVEKYPVITVEDIRKTAEKSDGISKQHILFTLMQAGLATEMFGAVWKELFDSKTGSCLRSCVQPDVWKALPILREAGGICVMAHPYTYRSLDLLHELLEQRLLDGIEVWQSKTTPEQENFLLQIAEEHQVIPTGGSDFHGAFGSKISPIGKGRTPERSIEALLSLRDKRHS